MTYGGKQVTWLCRRFCSGEKNLNDWMPVLTSTNQLHNIIDFWVTSTRILQLELNSVQSRVIILSVCPKSQTVSNWQGSYGNYPAFAQSSPGPKGLFPRLLKVSSALVSLHRSYNNLPNKISHCLPKTTSPTLSSYILHPYFLCLSLTLSHPLIDPAIFTSFTISLILIFLLPNHPAHGTPQTIKTSTIIHQLRPSDIFTEFIIHQDYLVSKLTFNWSIHSH